MGFERFPIDVPKNGGEAYLEKPLRRHITGLNWLDYILFRYTRKVWVFFSVWDIWPINFFVSFCYVSWGRLGVQGPAHVVSAVHSGFIMPCHCVHTVFVLSSTEDDATVTVASKQLFVL